MTTSKSGGHIRMCAIGITVGALKRREYQWVRERGKKICIEPRPTSQVWPITEQRSTNKLRLFTRREGLVALFLVSTSHSTYANVHRMVSRAIFCQVFDLFAINHHIVIIIVTAIIKQVIEKKILSDIISGTIKLVALGPTNVLGHKLKNVIIKWINNNNNKIKKWLKNFN